MLAIFDDHGIRFEYPGDWELDVDTDGTRTTVALQAPGDPAFALIELDKDRPSPAELADTALEALRSEYPGLEVTPASETIDGHRAIGHDIAFLSLDATNACASAASAPTDGPC